MTIPSQMRVRNYCTSTVKFQHQDTRIRRFGSDQKAKIHMLEYSNIKFATPRSERNAQDKLKMRSMAGFPGHGLYMSGIRYKYGDLDIVRRRFQHQSCRHRHNLAWLEPYFGDGQNPHVGIVLMLEFYCKGGGSNSSCSHFSLVNTQ